MPPNESERLRSLRAHDVLPTLIEPLFDEFVALTAQVFGLPISLIAVVEEDEVLYPVHFGMPGPGPGRLPRAGTLCATAIAQDRAVVYHDLALETYPAVPAEALHTASQHGVRFYAGALLCLPDQYPLGTLCIVDRQPRTFSPAEERALGLLAALISHAIAVCHSSRTASDGARQWHGTRVQLQEEVRELTALVRYLFTRHGVQVPVPPVLLAQVERRLFDMAGLLREQPC
ncbi:hypothetical protein GCM10022409_23280 [Hymenobacter glaciei]|uniref:GAF domain-containing protein n=1 Tax=Hymenobacter glaciei TaxID=877209 RepID=A0ABP7U7T2_9BACT